ncbi:MAG: hypothetical protein AB7N24_11590 [Dehalococcoidia bacterium]
MTDGNQVAEATALRNCPEQRIGLALPAVLSDRVDALVALAEEAGERTTRKELIAALILNASSNLDEISTLLRRYRLATVKSALIADRQQSASFHPMPRKPGPRPRRQQE